VRVLQLYDAHLCVSHLCDAHCHPDALDEVFPGGEAERQNLKVSIISSSATPEDFQKNERLRQCAQGIPGCLFLHSYAVHPQLASEGGPGGTAARALCTHSLETFSILLEKHILSAVGETGFDLFDAHYKASEALQEELFNEHIEAALRYGLPVLVHVRKAMHKIFTYTKKLKRLPALVFHNFSGTAEDAASLLRRGVNCWFSFGNALLLNHKRALAACAGIPAERLLTETDAPWQPLRFRKYSRYADLEGILTAMAGLKGINRELFANIITENWHKAYLQGM
jgi:TatD DNase family protein